jgi:hypothetical protein
MGYLSNDKAKDLDRSSRRIATLGKALCMIFWPEKGPEMRVHVIMIVLQYQYKESSV